MKNDIFFNRIKMFAKKEMCVKQTQFENQKLEKQINMPINEAI